MGAYLGIDTSNYTTSISLYEPESGALYLEKQLLPVKDGARGLRQSDAVFLHVKQLGSLAGKMMAHCDAGALAAVGFSAFPRRVEGSYMPCFLVGDMVSEVLASVNGVPRYAFSHQEGHIAAALYSAGCLAWLEGEPFYAFHVSGGTTECLLVTASGSEIKTNLAARTLDLHAGQVIDRVGVMLGCSFPCGPALEKLADSWPDHVAGRAAMKGADCCLSGIENQCRTLLEKGKPHGYIAKYCLSSVQKAVEEMTKEVWKQYGRRRTVYAGGVMANRVIRAALTEKFGGQFAEPRFSSDNSAGISVLAAMKHTETVRKRI